MQRIGRHYRAFDVEVLQQWLFAWDLVGLVGDPLQLLKDIGWVLAAKDVLGLDLVFQSNAGTAHIFDDFDNGVLDPLWIDFATSPGPESGTVLPMSPGDILFRIFTTAAPEGTVCVANMDTTGFSSSSAAFVVLTAGPSDSISADLLAVIVESWFVLLADEVAILATAPLPPDPPNVTIVLVIAADGTLFVLANGAVVFVEPNTLGAPNVILLLAQSTRRRQAEPIASFQYSRVAKCQLPFRATVLSECLRELRETPLFLVLDLKNGLNSFKTSEDVQLHPHDIVLVPKSTMATIDQFVDQYINKLIPASTGFNVSYIFGSGAIVE